MTPAVNTVLDYAIVGGGVSGLYSAWRLLNDSPAGSTPSVAVFEGSGRLGGRLLSVEPPGIPQARVELGGMRIICPAQDWASSLVQHLKLATEPLLDVQPQNVAYIRGKRLRIFELDDPTKLPYALPADLANADALQNLTAVAALRALRDVIKQVLGRDLTTWQQLATTLNDEDWDTLAQEGMINGVPLRDLPMRYLMMKAIGNEALALAQDSCGYDSILHTWNAADGFPWNIGDYGPLVRYLHVVDGFEAVPLTIAQQFETAGGVIHMNHWLRSFDTAAPGEPFTLIFDGPDGSTTVQARNLILAMPRRSLEMLEARGPVLDPSNTHVRELMSAVLPIPLFKLAICYERAWWEEMPPVDPGIGLMRTITNGKSVTDLPLRQCIYWKVNPQNGHAVILIYDDGTDLDYWAGLRDSTSTPHLDDLAIAGHETELPNWSSCKAPDTMVQEVHRQLLEMHGVKDPTAVPAPYTAAYRDWGEDPFGGGANFWQVGVDSQRVAKEIVQPVKPYRVYICGEAYSHAQGWVEGALQTAEDMLQNHLGLPVPAWKQAPTALNCTPTTEQGPRR
ncbi:flavin monoamine oxidase family protein [Gemmatimonas sp.]|uniref:flavin monoamine oxidase family protein n=1 Tax=Gemmatimonas sp. TaxID=1962908 RepID=UPI003DA5E67E